MERTLNYIGHITQCIEREYSVGRFNGKHRFSGEIMAITAPTLAKLIERFAGTFDIETPSVDDSKSEITATRIENKENNTHAVYEVLLRQTVKIRSKKVTYSMRVEIATSVSSDELHAALLEYNR